MQELYRPVAFKDHKRRFSLVELLVVVAVIAILVSLLMPSLRNAYDKASMANCMMNLKQIHLASTVYSDGHGAYPERQGGSDLRIQPAWGTGGMGPGFLLWWYDYINPINFWCPEDQAVDEFGYVNNERNPFARRQFYEEVPGLGTFKWSGTHDRSGSIQYKWETLFRNELNKMGDAYKKSHIFADSGRRNGQFNPQITYFRGVSRQYPYTKPHYNLSKYYADTPHDNPDMIYMSTRVSAFEWYSYGTPSMINSVHGGKTKPMVGTIYNDGAMLWNEIPLFFPFAYPYFDSKTLVQRTSMNNKWEPGLDKGPGKFNQNDGKSHLIVGHVREGSDPGE